MIFNKFKIFILTLITSAFLIGCTSNLSNENRYTDIEKLIMSVVLSDEFSSVKEVEDKDGKKDLIITLNLMHSVKSVALDNALLKSTSIINLLETNYKDEFNDYKFIINASMFDVYGNEKKEKILEILVDNEEVEKINFVNFNYKNLELLSDIKKFNYLNEDTFVEDKLNNDELNKDEVIDINKQDIENAKKSDIDN